MSETPVKKDESFESMMRRFKKQVEQEGIIKMVRERQHYQSPSEKRRKKAGRKR